MSKKKNANSIAYFCIILILVLVILYSGLRILESTVFYNDQGQDDQFESKTISRNGVEYFPRQDITVMMVLGIDQTGPVESSGSYNNHGAADMVMLVIFDEKNEECNVLYLNRDTMLEMPVLGIGGKKAGTRYGQLALSHTYGTGLEDSCENTKETVMNFLHGGTIDYYIAMNMDAIPILNDAVGGVTVTVVDDFSEVDATITEGEVTLRGDQAINFVQTRKGVGDQLNMSRIQRHKEYIEGFLDAFRVKQEQSGEFIVSIYESVSPYLVTDCSVNAISGMIERYSDYEIKDIVTPEGKNVQGEEYYEFYVDEEKLDALVIKLFYAAK